MRFNFLLRRTAMSMMPATRIEFKKDISPEQAQQTCQQILSIAGRFNVMSRGNPMVVVVPTSNPEKLGRIRKLENVAKIGHQL
jgi:hypothetical protein